MWKSRSFWRLYLPFALLIIGLTVTIGIVSTRWQKAQLDSQLSEHLQRMALMLREQVAADLVSGDTAGLQSTVERLATETEMRVTLIDLHGAVLADSHEDPHIMENHRDRPEFVLAGKAINQLGESTRMSNTLKIPMRYVGVMIKNEDSPVGFGRVAFPRQEIDEQVAAIQWGIVQLCLVVAIISLLVTERVVAAVISPTVRLMQQSQEMAANYLPHVDSIRRSDEIETLGQTLNQLSQELGRRMVQLQENNEQLETVLRGMIEGVIAIDGAQQILFANQAACEMLDLDVPSDVGRMLWGRIRNPSLEEAVHRAMEHVGASRCELSLPGTSARTLAVNVTRIPGDQSSGAILVFHDVTDLRRLENMRRDFVANVSHELKTPLASIQAYSETLLNGALDDEENKRGFVRTISRQADRLESLIQDMLSLASFESKEDRFDLVAVDIVEIVALCEERHARKALEKQVELKLVGPRGPIYALADYEGFQQILDNLIDNAIKYSAPGFPVTVGWEEEAGMLRIEVSDQGIGIAPEHQDRIFERFYRVDKARARELGGTGLGLAIVKHLVSAFEGELALKSAPGEGTTFTVRIPAAPVDEAVLTASR